MNKGAKVVLTIGGISVGVYLLNKLSTANKLEIYSKKISLKGKKVSDLQLIYTMEVVNPSYSPLKINNVFLNIYDRKTQLGRIIVTTPIVIPPNATTDINLPVKLNVGSALYFIYEVIAKGVRKINLVGSINTEGLTLPINQNIDLDY